MTLSNIVIKIIGVVLALVGFALLLSVVGLSIFGIAFTPVWAAILLGFVFLGLGIYIVKGGTPSL